MGEQVFRSAGVKAQEIDLTGPKPTVPSGIPAGVIGTARKGPAFVPVTVPNFDEFITRFGDTDGELFAPLALRAWFNNGSRSGTFLRVLGAGDGKRRVLTATTANPNTGRVNRAGFISGQEIVQDNGTVGNNPYAGTVADGHTGGGGYGLEGRTFMFGCFMSESSPLSTYLREAGITEGNLGNGWNSPPTTVALGGIVTGSKPILRGILMTASGVIAALSGDGHINNTPLTSHAARYTLDGASMHGATFTTATFGQYSTDNGGGFCGDVAKDTNNNGQFVVLLNGHSPSAAYPAVITASFLPNEPGYFANVMNTDPLKTEQAGHLLYAHWNVYPAYAGITGSHSALSGTGVGQPQSSAEPGGNKPPGRDIAFMVTASVARNSGSINDALVTTDAFGVPNYDGFEDRYQAAFSPYVTSQDMGDGAQSLFRFVALSDGVGNYAPTNLDVPPERMKLSIYNIKKSKSTKPGDSQYGTFDLLIRDLHDNDKNILAFEKFTNLNLNPASENYIARRIGDQYMYYEFDRDPVAQKLTMAGKFPNKSTLVRVEMDPTVDQGAAGISPAALPVGFRGMFHLQTSGTGIITATSGSGLSYTPSVPGTTWRPTNWIDKLSALSSIVQPPIPYRRNLGVTQAITTIADTDLYWGLQTTKQISLNEPNKSLVHDESVDSWSKYFPMYNTNFPNPWVGNNPSAADKAGAVVDCDRFNNNRFTLERVQVATSTLANVDLPDPLEWGVASYRRAGILADLTKSDGTIQVGRFLNVEKDFGDSSTQKYLKFNFMMQGGFDGLNILERENFKMTNLSVRREFDDANQGGLDGSSLQAYRTAVDILGERADADIQLMTIPGIRHQSITDYAIDAIENRFDAFYIMDIEQKDAQDTFVTSSAKQFVDVGTTTRRFQDRNLDTSFAAAYFPDLILNDAGTNTLLAVPPSVGVLGAFALNDTLGHPWFAPAGFTRGALASVDELDVQLNQNNLDNLYSADINPITSFPDTGGPKVYGQKTLLKAQSSLDRVNVRRLLIEVRRRVRRVGDTILFEPNRAETLARFEAAVNPILKQIQQQQGVTRFKVQIDTTTTTQADIENNTIRGKIFLQPTKAIEFIALDFVITNTINADAL